MLNRDSLYDISDRASLFKLILDMEADIVEYRLKIFVSKLPNSRSFLILPDTVLLAISL